MGRPEKIRLGDLLIQQGLLTNEQLSLSLDEQKRSGRKLGRIVVEQGYVTEEAIARALARQLQTVFVDLKSFNPRKELINRLPEAQARRFRAVVLDEIEGRLRVGFADPTDLHAYDEIVRTLRHDIEPAVVAESQLLALIDRVYHRTEEISGLAKELTAKFIETRTVSPGNFAEIFPAVYRVVYEAIRNSADETDGPRA